MPTYEYVCEKCGHRFDFFQSMNDPKLTGCPLNECDGAVRRLPGTGAGLIFKGGGFYQTDYRSDSYKSGQKQEADSSKPKETKAEDGKKAEGGKKSEGGKKAEGKSSDAGGSSGGGGSSASQAD